MICVIRFSLTEEQLASKPMASAVLVEPEISVSSGELKLPAEEKVFPLVPYASLLFSVVLSNSLSVVFCHCRFELDEEGEHSQEEFQHCGCRRRRRTHHGRSVAQGDETDALLQQRHFERELS